MCRSRFIWPLAKIGRNAKIKENCHHRWGSERKNVRLPVLPRTWGLCCQRRRDCPRTLDPNTDLGQQVIRQFGPEILADGKSAGEGLLKKYLRIRGSLQNLKSCCILPCSVKSRSSIAWRASSEAYYLPLWWKSPSYSRFEREPFYDDVVAVLADRGRCPSEV